MRFLELTCLYLVRKFIYRFPALQMIFFSVVDFQIKVWQSYARLIKLDLFFMLSVFTCMQ